MAAPAFRSVGTFVNSAFGTPTVPYPAGVAAGDLLCIQFICPSGVTPTTPSGWTKLFGPTTATQGGVVGHFYYKIAGASEPSSVTFANTGSTTDGGGVMFAYTGADTTTPINVSATATLPTGGTTSTVTTPSVTTTKADTRLLRMYWGGVGATTSVTPAGTDTERSDVFWSPGFAVMELADSAQAAAGASGTTTATFSTVVYGGVGVTVAVAPVAAPTAPVADFTGTPVTGTAPLSVTFTDASTNTPTSWAWDFGDSGTSSSQNPSHSYAAAGTYTVALVATNAGGSNTKTRTGYVTVASGFVPQIMITG